MKKKIKILDQENNWVRLFGEMTNASALSEKKPPLTETEMEKVYLLLMIFGPSAGISHNAFHHPPLLSMMMIMMPNPQ